jgi:cytidylate kinase
VIEVERRPSATVIAIDGPAGSGKSTLALRLAARLGLPYVNTGLMYRALTLAALREGVDPEDGGALVELAGAITFDLDPRQVPPQLRIDGAPPDPDLLSTQVEGWVSQVSRHTGVRALMRDEQRRLGGAGAVMEGRDIGSVVFPDATLRVLLVAGPQARASRRALEREVAPLPEVRRAIDRRDELDARNVPPLEPDLELDTTHLDADAVFEMVLASALQRLGEGR